jgi:hypothetical protein
MKKPTKGVSKIARSIKSAGKLPGFNPIANLKGFAHPKGAKKPRKPRSY